MSEHNYTLNDLVAFSNITEEQSIIMRYAVRNGARIVIGGKASTGKTTLLQSLVMHIAEPRNIVSVGSLDLKYNSTQVWYHTDLPSNLDAFRTSMKDKFVVIDKESITLDVLELDLPTDKGFIRTVYVGSMDVLKDAYNDADLLVYTHKTKYGVVRLELFSPRRMVYN